MVLSHTHPPSNTWHIESLLWRTFIDGWHAICIHGTYHVINAEWY